MARLEGVELGRVSDGYITKVSDAQARTWGSPLLDHLIYEKCRSPVRPSTNAVLDRQRAGFLGEVWVNERG